MDANQEHHQSMSSQSNQICVLSNDSSLTDATGTLTLEDYEVIVFRSPADALARITEPNAANPAAVVLDLDVPDFDPVEFLREARRAGLLSPIIVISDDHAGKAAQELEAAAAVTKPVDPDALLHAVQQVVSTE